MRDFTHTHTHRKDKDLCSRILDVTNIAFFYGDQCFSKNIWIWPATKVEVVVEFSAKQKLGFRQHGDRAAKIRIYPPTQFQEKWGRPPGTWVIKAGISKPRTQNPSTSFMNPGEWDPQVGQHQLFGFFLGLRWINHDITLRYHGF